jgi:hypothetical protein
MILSERAEAVRTMNWEWGGHHQNRNGVGEVLIFGHWIVRHNGKKIAIGLPADYI